MNETTITVIILTYNHEGTIARALDSVLEQKTNYNYQIMICEDCSTDNTLEICKEYEKKHPEKVKLFAQSKNTRLRHLREALCRIDTEYLALLEGDDYWCDENKIQTGLDILEKNLEYVTFAHDTVYSNQIDGTNKSLVNEIHKIKIKNPVNFIEAPYLHTSARIHRNVIDFNKWPKKLIIYDIYLFYLFLDKGDLYYYDKIMSVYNITGAGVWSKLAKNEQEKNTDVALYKTNVLLNYKHDLFFSEKIKGVKELKKLKAVFGLWLGWKIYILLR